MEWYKFQSQDSGMSILQKYKDFVIFVMNHCSQINKKIAPIDI